MIDHHITPPLAPDGSRVALLLAGAGRTIAPGAGRHTLRVDLLIVEQMRGRFKVKHPGLQPLHAKARLLAYDVGRVTFEHVRRELNQEADRLSNLGMDEAEETLKSER